MRIFLACIGICMSGLMYAQTATFFVLEMPTSASVNALGGIVTSSNQPSGSVFLENPSLLHDSLDQEVYVNFLYYFAGTSYLNANYSTMIKGLPFVISGQRFSYGDFDGFDASGNATGTFGAGDNLITVSTAVKSNNFTLGLAVKYLHSTLAGFSSHALITDVGVTFRHPEKDFSASALLNNAGVILNPYSGTGADASIPFDIQLGMAFKPENMPIRFNVTAYNIVPSSRSVLYEQEFSTTQKLFSYLNLGGEFLLSENIQFLAGYNFLRRYELQGAGGPNGEGFSYGLRIKNEKLKLEYGRSRFHTAGVSHMFTLGLNTGVFKSLYKRRDE